MYRKPVALTSWMSARKPYFFWLLRPLQISRSRSSIVKSRRSNTGFDDEVMPT